MKSECIICDRTATHANNTFCSLHFTQHNKFTSQRDAAIAQLQRIRSYIIDERIDGLVHGYDWTRENALTDTLHILNGQIDFWQEF